MWHECMVHSLNWHFKCSSIRLQPASRALFVAPFGVEIVTKKPDAVINHVRHTFIVKEFYFIDYVLFLRQFIGALIAINYKKIVIRASYFISEIQLVLNFSHLKVSVCIGARDRSSDLSERPRQGEVEARMASLEPLPAPGEIREQMVGAFRASLARIILSHRGPQVGVQTCFSPSTQSDATSSSFLPVAGRAQVLVRHPEGLGLHLYFWRVSSWFSCYSLLPAIPH